MLFAVCAIISTSAVYGNRDSFSSSSSASREETSESTPAIRKSSTPLSKILNFHAPREAENLSGQELVDYVNRNQDLWTARLNEKFNSYDEVSEIYQSNGKPNRFRTSSGGPWV